jgi:hypothetical protein
MCLWFNLENLAVSSVIALHCHAYFVLQAFMTTAAQGNCSDLLARK